MNIDAFSINIRLLSIADYIFGEKSPTSPSTFNNVILIIHSVIMISLFVIYIYQVIMSVASIFLKGKKFKESDNRPHFIFLTCARNEENVVKQLYDSIRKLDYPQDKIEIHLVADNCSDETSTIAKNLGMRVFERHDLTQVGKSYALDYYFKQTLNEQKVEDFAGYIIVDTDNVYDKNYLKEINKTLQETNARVIAAYRASSNIGDSLWAYGTGYSFLRECTLLHKVREHIGVSSYVSGTSFFVSHSKIVEMGGFTNHLLIEDIEFSTVHVLNGEITHYNHDAIFYDEQPNNFGDSMRQRLRWVKGLYEISHVYGLKIFASLFKKKKVKNKLSSVESFIFATPIPGYIIWWYIIFSLISIGTFVFTKNFDYFLVNYLYIIFDAAVSFYVFTTIMSYMITFSDWKRIKMSATKKLLLPLVGFFFLLTYIPLFVIAPFVRVKWSKVHHYGVNNKLD